MNLPRIHGLAKTAAIFSVCFLAASLGFGATITNKALVTVNISPSTKYGTVIPNYNSQSLIIRTNPYYMTAKANPGFIFTGWTGNQTNNNPKLTFYVQTTNRLKFTANFVKPPTLLISSPANGSVLTQPEVVVIGAASDNDAVTNVVCQLVSQGSTNPCTALTGYHWNSWWVNLTLAPGTNILQAWAIDRSGNHSPTNKLKLIYSAAPATLAGTTLTVTNADNYFITFSTGTNGTFSEETSVGSYTYKKTGSLNGKLSLHYIAPPSASNNDIVLLQFTNATGGIFTGADADRGDAFTNSFTFSTATNWAPASLVGDYVVLTSTNGTNSSLLTFLKRPNVVTNGGWFATNNPLNVSLDAPYPGNIGDRVIVTFAHLKYASGIWVSNAPQDFSGSVINTDSPTNTVTILFDVPWYLYSLRSDLFLPEIMNILTFYYSDYSGTNLITNNVGAFIYTNYSPIGSLLKLNWQNTNSYYILTFTNAALSGTFYTEAYGADGSSSANSGSFAIAAPPQITNSPTSQTVPVGGTTNFTVAATGSQPLSYQWQFNGTNLTDITTDWGSIISGSSTTNLTITGAATNDAGNYTIIVSNALGSATNSATLTVGTPPQITSPPLTQSVSNGLTATFTVTATGTPTLAYQWQFAGSSLSFTNILGSTKTNLVINPASTNNIGNYQVVVTNNFGATSASFYLDVTN